MKPEFKQFVDAVRLIVRSEIDQSRTQAEWDVLIQKELEKLERELGDDGK